VVSRMIRLAIDMLAAREKALSQARQNYWLRR
jgi:hypothetical protein